MNNHFKFIDFSNLYCVSSISNSKYTNLNIVEEKGHPSKKYVFKTFNFQCISSKTQNIFITAFYQNNSHKCPYLQRYKSYSFSYFETNFHPTFSMNFISMTTLEKLLKDPNFKKEWNDEDVMRCLFAIAEGMCHLHNSLHCHGNLCPSNVIVDEAKQCYLVDFCIYPIKKLYMKSEDICNNDYKDPNFDFNEPKFSNDVYSFGVIMLELALHFFAVGNKQTLKEFMLNSKKDKFSKFPAFFTTLINDCLSPSEQERPSFNRIIDIMKKSTFYVGSKKMNDLYDDFIKMKYIVNLADKDNAIALNKLGKMYEKSKGVKRDIQKALQYYEKAALLNYSEAQNNYGLLLQKEAKNDKEQLGKAAHFLEMSAKQENAHGMANFGVALIEGIGVQINKIEGEKYLKKSADLNYSYAQAKYGYHLLKSTNDIQEKEKAIGYIKKAIFNGDPEAHFIYSILLQHGKEPFVDKNEELADHYLELAGKMNHEKASIIYCKKFFEKFKHSISAPTSSHHPNRNYTGSTNFNRSNINNSNINLLNINSNEQQNEDCKQIAENLEKSNLINSNINIMNISASKSTPPTPYRQQTKNQPKLKLYDDTNSHHFDHQIRNGPEVPAPHENIQRSKSNYAKSPANVNKVNVIYNSTVINRCPSTPSPAIRTMKYPLPQNRQSNVNITKVIVNSTIINQKENNDPLQDNAINLELEKNKMNDESPQKIEYQKQIKVEEKPNDKIEVRPNVKVEEKPNIKEEEKPNIKEEEKQNVKVEERPNIKEEERPNIKEEERPNIKEEKINIKEEKINIKEEKINIKEEERQIIKRGNLNAKEESTIDFSSSSYSIESSENDEEEMKEHPQNKNIPTFDRNLLPTELLEKFKFYRFEYFSKRESENDDRSHYRLFQFEDAFISTQNAKVIYHFGKLYSNDESFESREKALKYFKRAADLGHGSAQIKYGTTLYNENIDKEKGLKIIMKAAINGKSQAFELLQYYFGIEQSLNKNSDICTCALIYLIQSLKLKNHKSWVFLMKELADSENERYKQEILNARFEYARELFYGKLIEKNENESFEYFIKSNQISEIKEDYPDIYEKMSQYFSNINDIT